MCAVGLCVCVSAQSRSRLLSAFGISLSRPCLSVESLTFGRQGHGNTENCHTAKLVSLPALSKTITQVAVGEHHSLLLTGTSSPVSS
jgi:hypothetical protein